MAIDGAGNKHWRGFCKGAAGCWRHSDRRKSSRRTQETEGFDSTFTVATITIEATIRVYSTIPALLNILEISESIFTWMLVSEESRIGESLWPQRTCPADAKRWTASCTPCLIRATASHVFVGGQCIWHHVSRCSPCKDRWISMCSPVRSRRCGPYRHYKVRPVEPFEAHLGSSRWHCTVESRIERGRLVKALSYLSWQAGMSALLHIHEKASKHKSIEKH